MADCVFCNPENIVSRKIATIGNTNVVITLGQITEGGYVLLIPTNHSPCLGASSKSQIKFISNIAKLISGALIAEYKNGLTIFEHGIVGQTIKHSHLHFLPVKLNLTNRVHLDFPESDIQIIKNLSEIQSSYQTRQEPYLLWSVSGNLFAVCWNPPAPAQYFRTICAEMLDVPERANWKMMDPQKDKSLADETMRRLSPYFSCKSPL